MNVTTVRQELAALYRAIDICGWSDTIYTHISARIPGTDTILLNYYGLLNEEICASNLVEVPLHGEPSNDVNLVGYNIHKEIHIARPDVNYIIHAHSPDVIAVGCQQQGLLPLTQHAVFISQSLSYHDYRGIVYRHGDSKKMAEDLGNNKCMLLKNHGSIVVGATAASAFFYQYMLDKSCKVQVKAGSAGISPIPMDTVDISNNYSGNYLPRQSSTQLLWDAMLRKLNKLCPGYDR